MCYTERVYKASKFFLFNSIVQPCLSKNPKYTLYAIKSSLTLAYNCYSGFTGDTGSYSAQGL